jgi:hypothetical protein
MHHTVNIRTFYISKTDGTSNNHRALESYHLQVNRLFLTTFYKLQLHKMQLVFSVQEHAEKRKQCDLQTKV